jgi:hypothetical protein
MTGTRRAGWVDYGGASAREMVAVLPSEVEYCIILLCGVVAVFGAA